MKSILITGGTGFFGNAFVKRLLAGNEYDRVCIFSRDEFKQAQMRDKFCNDSRLRWFIGDVRDKERLTRAMIGVDIVVHAAALKRIEVGAYNPTEMVKTNVLGTMNVIDASITANVKRVIYLSTDKAFQPVSPYGQSKALAESIMLAANNTVGEHGPSFVVTRYGNVANSTGSVIPRWRALLQSVDTVPVTDPDCTRFWMTDNEAVDLVLSAIDDDLGQKLWIPMLPAYRLGDLAIAIGAPNTLVTGLPAYEKRHESMDYCNCSKDARRMSIEELRQRLEELNG